MALFSTVAGIFGADQTLLNAAAVMATVDAFHDALAGGDAQLAMALLGRDAVIVENGTVESRAEYEREHLADDIAFARTTSSTRSSLIIRQEGDLAWITSTLRTTGSFKGKRVKSITAELMVLSKTPNGWQIRAIHWSSHRG